MVSETSRLLLKAFASAGSEGLTVEKMEALFPLVLPDRLIKAGIVLEKKGLIEMKKEGGYKITPKGETYWRKSA